MSSTSNGRLIDRRGPAWFDFARRVALFVLGFYTICYALVTTGHDVAFLVTGLILTSTIPIEDALRALTRQEGRHMPETDDPTETDETTDETAADETTDETGADDETDPKHALI